MAEPNLSQTEADALIAMEKHREDDARHAFPLPGGSLTVPLVSADRREQFLLDISRGRIDLAKVKMQNRARQVIVLVRLDLAGAPHRNPDGAEVPCPHLHLFREGFGDKWAAPISPEDFASPHDNLATLNDFMRFCNIAQPPIIEQGLFA